MTTVADRVDGLRAAVATRRAALPAGDALAPPLAAIADKLDAIRKPIVATTEGGAITGEERLREHLDTVYRAMLRWEGEPTRYQVDRVAALARVSRTTASLFAPKVLLTQ